MQSFCLSTVCAWEVVVLPSNTRKKKHSQFCFMDLKMIRKSTFLLRTSIRKEISTYSLIIHPYFTEKLSNKVRTKRHRNTLTQLQDQKNFQHYTLRRKFPSPQPYESRPKPVLPPSPCTRIRPVLLSLQHIIQSVLSTIWDSIVLIISLLKQLIIKIPFCSSISEILVCLPSSLIDRWLPGKSGGR